MDAPHSCTAIGNLIMYESTGQFVFRRYREFIVAQSRFRAANKVRKQNPQLWGLLAARYRLAKSNWKKASELMEHITIT